LFYLIFYCYAVPPHLHSFPTRRSSDLSRPAQKYRITILFRNAVFSRSARLHVAARRRARPCGRGGGLGARPAHRAAHERHAAPSDRKSTRLNSSHVSISYAVFCLKKQS